MTIKWCYWCPVNVKHPCVLLSCNGPYPTEAYIETDD